MRLCARCLFVAATLVLGAGRAAAGTVPCVGGMAGRYPCDKVDLLAFMTPILGLTNATSFVDVTDPVNLVYPRLAMPRLPGLGRRAQGPVDLHRLERCDELDEQELGTNTRTYTWDLLARVDGPVMFTGPGRAVVSNAVETDTRPGDRPVATAPATLQDERSKK